MRTGVKQTVLMAAMTIWAGAAAADHELDGRDVARGAGLYQEQCAACHGADLEGAPNWRSANADGTLPAPPHDETGHTWHHDNVLLFDYTKLGGQVALEMRGVTGFTSAMPAFGDQLSDEEIWNILAYIRSTWPEEVQRIQKGRNPRH
ncbi:c-type cytochrome [Aestuariivita boseongensis]|uniref:c-type cytochrome n=1 Tax=Aestuariivita boseongensis TaxID=1470562 RepID=UPI0009E43E53